jgi:hypothetical protein
LIDVTSSLRTAAYFALNDGAGYVVVAGLPYGTGSIAFDIDQHVVLARLAAVCPPVARRPHLQEGFLVGHLPFDLEQPSIKDKSDLRRRTVAVFKVRDDKGSFWDEDFPKPTEASVLPKEDVLATALRKEFGPDAAHAIEKLLQ